jgi:hypothetical protein
MPRNSIKRVSKATRLNRASTNFKSNLHRHSRVGQSLESERYEYMIYESSGNNNEDEDEDENKDDNEYEDDEDEFGSEHEDEIEENRHEKEYRQPLKKPSAKHREMITGNKIRQQLVSPNSNS